MTMVNFLSRPSLSTMPSTRDWFLKSKCDVGSSRSITSGCCAKIELMESEYVTPPLVWVYRLVFEVGHANKLPVLQVQFQYLP